MGVTNSGGKGGAPTVYGRSMSPDGQPQFGMPNQYANSVGAPRLDNASFYPRQQPMMGGGKGGKMQPSGVGAPSATASGVGAPTPSPVTPLGPINSAGSLYASRGATGDQEGMNYWQGRYAAGEDPAKIQRDFNASFDYVKNQQRAG